MPAPAVRRRPARSFTRTRQPRCASAQAAVSPAKPPPTISALPFISARIPDHAGRAHREVSAAHLEDHFLPRERRRAIARPLAWHRLEFGELAVPAGKPEGLSPDRVCRAGLRRIGLPTRTVTQSEHSPEG